MPKLEGRQLAHLLAGAAPQEVFNSLVQDPAGYLDAVADPHTSAAILASLPASKYRKKKVCWSDDLARLLLEEDKAPPAVLVDAAIHLRSAEHLKSLLSRKMPQAARGSATKALANLDRWWGLENAPEEVTEWVYVPEMVRAMVRSEQFPAHLLTREDGHGSSRLLGRFWHEESDEEKNALLKDILDRKDDNLTDFVFDSLRGDTSWVDPSLRSELIKIRPARALDFFKFSLLDLPMEDLKGFAGGLSTRLRQMLAGTLESSPLPETYLRLESIADELCLGSPFERTPVVKVTVDNAAKWLEAVEGRDMDVAFFFAEDALLSLDESVLELFHRATAGELGPILGLARRRSGAPRHPLVEEDPAAAFEKIFPGAHALPDEITEAASQVAATLLQWRMGVEGKEWEWDMGTWWYIFKPGTERLLVLTAQKIERFTGRPGPFPSPFRPPSVRPLAGAPSFATKVPELVNKLAYHPRRQTVSENLACFLKEHPELTLEDLGPLAGIMAKAAEAASDGELFSLLADAGLGVERAMADLHLLGKWLKDNGVSTRQQWSAAIAVLEQFPELPLKEALEVALAAA